MEQLSWAGLRELELSVAIVSNSLIPGQMETRGKVQQFTNQDLLLGVAVLDTKLQSAKNTLRLSIVQVDPAWWRQKRLTLKVN